MLILWIKLFLLNNRRLIYKSGEIQCSEKCLVYWLDFRDTAGQRNFRTIGRGYYASTKAFVLVYDVTNMETFRLIEHFSQLIEQVC